MTRKLTMNSVGVVNNPYQQYEQFKRVLTVCSAGCLRSPTAALVLSMEPFNFNTRAAGVTEEYAIVAVDEILVAWADEIVVMEPWQKKAIEEKFPDVRLPPITVLNIPDRFAYRDPELIELIKMTYQNGEPHESP